MEIVPCSGKIVGFHNKVEYIENQPRWNNIRILGLAEVEVEKVGMTKKCYLSSSHKRGLDLMSLWKSKELMALG